MYLHRANLELENKMINKKIITDKLRDQLLFRDNQSSNLIYNPAVQIALSRQKSEYDDDYTFMSPKKP